MVLVTVIIKRLFSETTRVSRYATKKQLELVVKGQKIRRQNKLVEGMNEANTNYLDIGKPKESSLQLKPIQHPVQLNVPDTSIVSYQVPPKNLTPYYHIPNEALAPISIKKFVSPLEARHLEVCILGAPNAGKSSILNYITERAVSAVSNKYNTTDEPILGIYTDYDAKSQICLYDTPGVTKASNSLRSKLLITKAWNKIEDADLVMFVVDSVKKLDFQVKESIKRLKKITIDPENQKILDQIKDGTFSEEKFERGNYSMTEEERRLHSYVLPQILVLNKVDLVTNKIKFRELQNELEDLGEFEKIFHVSAHTGFGMQQLRDYLLSRTKLRPWEFHPEMRSNQSEVEKAEEAMKQAIFEKYFQELPYQIGIKVTGWVPKLNGELRIDFQLDVKNKVQVGMVLGEKGRILKEVRERATQILTEKIQRPVVLTVDITQRRNRIDAQNQFDSFNRVAK